MRSLISFLCLLALSTAGATPLDLSSELTPRLSLSQLNRLKTLLSSTSTFQNPERLEKEYQRILHHQTLHDLALIYDPANSKYLRTTYASFSATHSSGGDDLGFGLHIVKRLDLPISSGLTKTIYVNELWPEDPNTGGLFAPDEIRIQTRFQQTKDSTTPGSHEEYFFDSIRLAWGPSQNEVEIHRQTLYDGSGRYLQRRVPVSAPLSCRDCHDKNNFFGDSFLQNGEAKNFAAIVQDGAFSLRPEEMKGFQEYIAYLSSSGRRPEILESTRKRLSNILTTSQVPGLLAAILRAQELGISWIAEDAPFVAAETSFPNRQGVYRDSGKEYLDSIETLIEGKYRWWFPTLFFEVR